MENVIAVAHKDLWCLVLLHVMFFLAESLLDLKQKHHLTYGLCEFSDVVS